MLRMVVCQQYSSDIILGTNVFFYILMPADSGEWREVAIFPSCGTGMAVL